MSSLITCLLALFFSLSSAALEGNANFWCSSLAAKEGQTLFHYTNEKGLAGILESGELRPSLKALNPNVAGVSS